MSKKLVCIVALLLALTPAISQADGGVRPPNANQYGKGYDGLAGQWLTWVMSIPWSTNPIADSDGSYAAIGQSSPVWFLAGTQGDVVERSLTIPAGNAQFFPIVNFFWVNTPELGDNPWSAEQEALARSVLAYFVDTAQNLVLEVDGQAVPNLSELRALSTVEMCMLPADNLFGASAGPHECVGDGCWALLPPLSVGEHTVHFEGEFGAVPGFLLDVTYHVTVAPRR
jgi:hypothetical protein